MRKAFGDFVKGIGIVGYGAYIPKRRIKVEEIARVWGKDVKRITEGLGIKEKAVAAFDEDSATMAVESARRAVQNSGVDAKRIGAVFVGSESKPYAVKPTAAAVADAIGASPELTAADFEFACKSGTTAMQCCLGMVASGMIEYGLAIGTDTAQGSPNDPLEFSTGGGGASVIVGNQGVIADFEEFYSYTTDTPDFWRRPSAEFPQAAGRFTGEPAYFRHVINAAKGLFAKTGLEPKDFDHVVFHQPNAKFPLKAAKILGFEEEKLKQGLVTPFIGNTYSACSFIGLASILDVAREGERILVVSYGSGAGADALSFKATKEAERKRPKETIFNMIKEKEYVDYATYVKHRRKLKDV
ncbi:hydroxymethylglutaryl-CoA synthase [Candidatus Micrarchaeota archaeon]|nr:hydroxymethylglutaryl-CoA synthase [Candidatus Micrarchaeota archaeon]